METPSLTEMALDRVDVEDMLDQAVLVSAGLTRWEQQFLVGIEKRFLSGRGLTPKEWEKLVEITDQRVTLEAFQRWRGCMEPAKISPSTAGQPERSLQLQA